MLGAFVDSTDGVTPESALTITQPDIRLSKNGGAFAQKSAAQTLTHGENGWYAANLSTTDTNTLGLLTVAVYESGALPVRREFMVVTAQVYDSYLSTDVLQVDVAQWLGTAAATPTVAGVPEVDVTHYAGSASIPVVTGGRYDVSVGAMQANVLTAAATAADFSVEVNASVLAVLGALADAAADGDPTAADTLMMYMKQLVNTLVGTVGIPTWPAAAAPANAVSLAEAIRQIYTLAGGLNGITPSSATAVAAVQTDVDDIQARLPAALVSGRMDSSVGAMAANVMTAAAADPGLTTELQTGLATSAALATVQADTDNLQTRLPAALVGGRMDSSVGAMANDVLTAAATATDFSTENNAAILAAMPAAAPTAATIADAVWDETLAGHLGAGSTGEALNGAGAAGDPWATALPGAYGAGSAGNIVGTNLNATVSSRASQTSVDAVQTDTDNIQTRLPTTLVSGRMDSSVGAMAANVMTAAAAAGDLTTELQTGLATSTALATVQADTDNIQTRLPAALVDGRMDANVSGWQGEDVATPTVAGVPEVDLTHWRGDTPLPLQVGQVWAYVGGMSANVVNASALATDAVTEINAPVLAAMPAAAPTAAVVADAVWDEAIAGHLTAGSTGAALNGAGSAGDPWTTPLPGAYGAGTAGGIVGNLDDAIAAVQTDTDNIQTRLPAALVGGKMDSTGGGGATAAEVADAVWDEALSGHAAVGSTGEALSDAAAGGGGGGSDPWATPVPGAYAVGTAGHILGNLVNSVWAVSLASITDAAARSPLNALRFLRNKWSVSDTTLTVTTEDDATTAWTATVTHDATAAPVVGNDPT